MSTYYLSGSYAKKSLLLLTFLMLTLFVSARKFYFSSSTGSDSYSIVQAQNQATPWASLKKLTQLVTNNTVCFAPGDTICFKRGDVFANGSTTDLYCTAYWWNTNDPTSPNYNYFTAPSGTPAHPIVITNYGNPSLPLPNWLHSRAFAPVSTWAPHLDSSNAANGITSYKTREYRGIIEFAGVHDIIIDGIQSNDIRLPEWDKQSPGFSGGWILGEWTRGNSAGAKNSYNDTSRRKNMLTRFIVRNCVFNNCIYGVNGLAAVDSKITNCTFTNFKSSADTAGTNDVLGAALEGVNGINCEISHNYIKGGWSKSGRISSTLGMGGVGIDGFNLYNSKICYNTFIDCSGAWEVGNLDLYDTTAGSQYDTFAFNKVINTGQLAYFHGSGFFAGTNHHIAFWNNTIISNNKDRLNGPGFGKDVYGDGQGWAPGTPHPFWFCRDPFNTLNVDPMRPTVATTRGSNIITVSTNAGISLGSVWFTDNDSLASLVYKTVTVTNINGNTITLSDPSTRTEASYTCANETGFYLPVANQTWSNPFNPAYANYGGIRLGIQYSSDATLHGSSIDTMFDFRNNIYYWTTGIQGVYDRNRYKRSANLYIPLGGARYATSLGGTLNYRGTGEILTNGANVFVDTSAALPDNWNLHLKVGSPAIGTGVAISGFTTDFDGSTLSSPPSMGLYNYSVNPNPCSSYTYSAWSSCVNGVQTRTATGIPLGCIGNPDSALSRACSNPCTSWTYSAWSTCVNNTQTRTAIGSPSGCTGTPDSVLSRSCTNACVFTYGQWTVCNGVSQTRSYTASPSGCIGTPPADSTYRLCNFPCTSWTYSAWTACVNNVQTRTAVGIPAGCTGGVPDSPLTRPCTILCSFTYGTWTACANGIQTRSYTVSPIGCMGTAPLDSVQRACVSPCTFTYGVWSACSSGVQTRPFTSLPAGCTGSPVIDSIQRTCVGTLKLSLVSTTKPRCSNTRDGSITVKATLGVAPYYYSINSTTQYILNKTIFSGLPKGTYTIRVKDATGAIVVLYVTLTSRRNTTCYYRGFPTISDDYVIVYDVLGRIVKKNMLIIMM